MAWVVRHGSPVPGGSILITSAPKSDRMGAAQGPAIQLAQSMTFRPVKRLSGMVFPRRFLGGEIRGDGTGWLGQALCKRLRRPSVMNIYRSVGGRSGAIGML